MVKNIDGFPGYQIHSTGQVFSLFSCKFLKPTINSDGYLCVNLYKENNKRGYFKYIHRLVGEAFILNPYNLPQINHKDEDKTNNFYLNLEWCNEEYNANYGTRNERISNSLLGKNYSEQNKLVQINYETNEIINIWDSIDIAADTLNIEKYYIIQSCYNNIQQYHNCIWQYGLVISTK